MGGKRSRCAGVSAAQRSFRIHEASGARSAPFGSNQPVDESKLIPVPSFDAHTKSAAVMAALRRPVSPPVGDMMTSSPSMARSMRRFRLARHSR